MIRAGMFKLLEGRKSHFNHCGGPVKLLEAY